MARKRGVEAGMMVLQLGLTARVDMLSTHSIQAVGLSSPSALVHIQAPVNSESSAPARTGEVDLSNQTQFISCCGGFPSSPVGFSTSSSLSRPRQHGFLTSSSPDFNPFLFATLFCLLLSPAQRIHLYLYTTVLVLIASASNTSHVCLLKCRNQTAA